MPSSERDSDEGEREISGAPVTPGPDDEWRLRREQLKARLDSRRTEKAGEGTGEQSTAGFQGMAQGLKLASEFVAGILVGAGLGYLIDRIFGTLPFGLVIFLLLGFVAGVLNVLRAVAKTGGTPPTAEG